MYYKVSWIFAGPHAEGTAEHHIKHLKQFSSAGNLPFKKIDSSRLDQYAVEVLVVCEEPVKDVLVNRLKPHRVEPTELA